MRQETLELLACPHCGGTFAGSETPLEQLDCSSCMASFAVENGVPNLRLVKDPDRGNSLFVLANPGVRAA